jgi:hypothetical protein
LRDAKLAGVLDDRADESAAVQKRSEEEERESIQQLKQLDREVIITTPKLIPGVSMPTDNSVETRI